MQTYARFALCETCTSERGQPGGDLLELAQCSTADVLAASKLAQYVTDLENDLWDEANGESERAALRQVMHAPAMKAIREHMHVYDDERVKLAGAYREAVHYAGHCCAICGVRDPVSTYSCKLFSLRGPRCVGPGYLRRRDGTGSQTPVCEE